MTTGTAARDEYRTLLAAYLPHSIASEEEAERVQGIIDGLIDTGPLSPAGADFLSLLGDLLRAWEGARYGLPNIAGVEAVRGMLALRGERQVDLVGPVFATRSVASAVLSGKRPLSAKMIVKLATYFHVSPALCFPRAETTGT